MDILQTFLLQNDENEITIKEEPPLEIDTDKEQEILEENEKEPSNRKKYRKLKDKQITFTCDICQKVFKRNFSLKIHKRIHFDEKPFKCELCPMDFNQKSNYTKHKLIHLNQKPHKCTKCDNTFSQKSHLKTHQMLHAAEDLKPYKCGHCNSGFSNNNCLMKHVQISHYGREMFKCDICDRIFVSKSGIKNHRKNHTMENNKSTRKRLDKFMIESDLEKRNSLTVTKNTKPKLVEPIKFELPTKFEIPTVGKNNFTKFGVPNACANIIQLPEIKEEPIEIYELSDSE